MVRNAKSKISGLDVISNFEAGVRVGGGGPWPKVFGSRYGLQKQAYNELSGCQMSLVSPQITAARRPLRERI